MISVLDEFGYRVVTPVQVLKAVNYNVPQKRERLILVGIRKDIDIEYEYPKPYNKVYNLRDALKKGDLYNCDVPESEGVQYPKRKRRYWLWFLNMVIGGTYLWKYKRNICKKFLSRRRQNWDGSSYRLG